MNQRQLAHDVQNARSNAANANNTAQALRVQVIDLAGTVSQQGAYIAHLEAQVHTLAERLVVIEDRLGGG